MSKKKKIVVPEGMLDAAMKASFDAGLGIGPSTELSIPLVAALQWLTDNILSESNPEFHRAILARERERYIGNPSSQVAFEYGASYARQFIEDLILESAPNPAIKDLLWESNPYPNTGAKFRHDESVIEAFRRGQEVLNANESKSFSASPSSANVCNECVVSFIAREGSYFPCALPKGHDGGHRAAGTCHKHGRYYGKVGKVPRCRQFPDCA